MSVTWYDWPRLAHRFGECRGDTVHRDRMKMVAVDPRQAAESRLAEPQRSFEHRVEHRGEVAGRRIDDLQDLGGRGLLLQRLARLGQQPRVFDRDDGLFSEVLD